MQYRKEYGRDVYMIENCETLLKKHRKKPMGSPNEGYGRAPGQALLFTSDQRLILRLMVS